LCKLNSVANRVGHGRDDLDAGILIAAQVMLKTPDDASNPGDCAAQYLARDVVKSFERLRGYLRYVASLKQGCVDPDLRNNAGLVQCLCDWEKSWESGAKYLRNPCRLNVLCQVVADLHAAKRLLPDLTEMALECDVELLLSLPRLVWLKYLACPEEHDTEVTSFMPIVTKATLCHIEQSGNAFHQALNLLMPLWRLPGGPGAYDAVAAFLAAWAVGGTGSSAIHDGEETFRHLCKAGNNAVGPQGWEPVQAALDNLMHEIEPLSMELQRYQPKDWNQFAALCLQCFTQERSQVQAKKFTV